MRQPSKKAVQSAVSILLRSIIKENNNTSQILQSLPTEFDNVGATSLVATSEALITAQATLQAECLSQVAAIHKQLNRLVPISKLHRELFEDILLDVVNEGAWSVTVLHRLARVSTFWWDVVRTSSRLWAMADIGLRPAELDLALRKSGSAPLRIDAVYRSGYFHNPKDFIRRIIPHLKRCKVLAAGSKRDCTIDGVPELAAIFEHDLPELIDLRLESVWAANYIGRRFWGELLRRVHLQATAIEWPELSGLTHLTIDENDSLTPNMLLQVLAASPDLNYVYLKRLLPFPRRYDPGDLSAAQIVLPRLRAIIIESSTDEHTDHLLSAIVAESLQKLHIWAYNRLTTIEDEHNKRPVWFTGRGLQRQVNTVIRNAKISALDVIIDPADIVTISDGPFVQANVAVSVHIRNLPERWWGLLENIQLPLRMFVPSLNNRGFFQPCMLGDLTTLGELEVGDAYAYRTVRYLTAPIDSGLPCPRLRKLTLIVDVRWGIQALVVKLLEARKLSAEKLVVYDGDGKTFDAATGSFLSQ